MDSLYTTQKVVIHTVGTSPKAKVHHVIHAKIKGQKDTNDAAFQIGSIIIEGYYS